MPEQPPPNPPALLQVQATIHAIAQVLRQPGQLRPETQKTLAELVDELGATLQSATVPSDELAHLTESTAHLLQALQKPHETGVLAAARDRLEGAIVRAESEAPVAAGLARRLVETLSNLGI
jgi:hypothetical protein